MKIEKANGFLSLEEPLKTFEWNGVHWSIDIILGRVFWVLTAFLIIIIASAFFRGFDHVATKERKGIFSKFKSIRAKQSPHIMVTYNECDKIDAKNLAPVKLKFSLAKIVASELKLLLRNQKWWWYIVQGFLIAACIISPISETRTYYGPLSWCWPLLIWSSMGTREVRNSTNQIVFTSPYPIQKKFPAAWLSGFIITLLSGVGMGLKFLIMGDIKAILAWCVGAMFIPTLAYTLGIWTRNSKAFEGIYLAMMFAGLLNNIRGFDFIGVLDKSIEYGMPIRYLIISVLLALIALYGRRRQIKV